MANQQFVIDAFEGEDVGCILELFAACYGGDRDKVPSRAEWEWRYRGGLYGSTVWTATHGERLAAQRPAVVKAVKIGQQQYPAAHFMDVMTHPAFRYQGLFTRLVRLATERVMERGAAICYSFPNEESFPGYLKKTDWVSLDILSLFVKPLRLEPLLRTRVDKRWMREALSSALQPAVALASRVGAMRPAAPGPIWRLAAFDERFDALWERASSDYEVILRRDSHHLNWRYCQRPSVEYAVYAVGSPDVRGYVVLRTRRMFGMKLGMIVELMVADRDEGVARVLVDHGVQHLLECGAEAVACVVPDRPPFGSALRRQGFLRVPRALLPRRFHFLVRVRSAEQHFSSALDPQEWYLSWGDNDAV